jgi:hypothetical protein
MLDGLKVRKLYLRNVSFSFESVDFSIMLWLYRLLNAMLPVSGLLNSDYCGIYHEEPRNPTKNLRIAEVVGEIQTQQNRYVNKLDAIIR